MKQNANNIEVESGGQSKEENLTNKVNEINLRENGPNGNNGEKTNDSAEKDSEKSEIVVEKSSDEKDLTNNEEHVNAAEPPGEGEEILDIYHKMKQGQYYWSETSDIFDDNDDVENGNDDVELVMMTTMTTVNFSFKTTRSES